METVEKLLGARPTARPAVLRGRQLRLRLRLRLHVRLRLRLRLRGRVADWAV